MAKRDAEAERMVLNLSNFFRTTLSIDPTDDVTLSEEMALQMLYLDIEKARFPNRLQVEVDIPKSLATARVPALLLQPVVENAIKYGVARTRNIVTLSIRAESLDDDMLHVVVENSGVGVAPSPPQAERSGTGVGLTNVCQRLAARFGGRAHCSFGATDDGGFRVSLTLPRIANA
jgi:LytS/YehU family sensor histidine kinase